MSIFRTSDFTFNREQITEISQALFESAFSKPALTDFHNVIEGIVTDKQLAILGRLEGLIGAGSGGCSPTPSTNEFGGVDKTWTPKLISDRLPAQCYSDLEQSFWVYGLKQGIQRSDLTGTDFANYVIEILQDAIYECVLRVAWFGDVNADHVSGTGVITNGTNLAYFNKLNGFFQQIDGIVGADPNRLTLGLNTKNAQATYLLQEFDSTDVTNRVVMTTLQNMRFGADMRLRGKADQIFVVTQSVADQYQRELELANISFTTEFIQAGVQMLKNGGITVISFQLWDRIIRSFYDNGTTYFMPHRAVLLSKENTMIGCPTVGSLSDFDVIYDNVNKNMFFDFEIKMDAKIGIDYLVQVAY